MKPTPLQAASDTAAVQPPASFRKQLKPLLLLTSIFGFNFIARVIISPLLPAVEADLGIGHGVSGGLFFMISAGYCVSQIGSSAISSRLTHRKTIVLSSVVLGLALLGVSLAPTIAAVGAGMLLLGLAAGFYLPSGIATLTGMIAARHWGKAIAVHEMAPNISFVAAPVICQIVMLWFEWRTVLAIIAVCSLLSGTVFAFWGRGGEFYGQAPSVDAARQLIRLRSFWIMVMLFVLGIAGLLGIYAMLPLYLVTKMGFTQSQANSLVALSRIPGIAIVFGAGWLTDRLGPRLSMQWIYGFMGTFTILLGLSSPDWIVPVVFLQPMAAVCFPPAAVVAISMIGPPASRNFTLSLTVPLAFLLGAGAIPGAIGFMGDRDAFGLGFVLVGILVLTGTLLPRFLKLE